MHSPNRRRLAGLCLALLIVTGGCATLSDAPGPGDSAPANTVNLIWSVDSSGEQFHIEGSVTTGRGAAPDQNYSSVSVVLYDENRTVIARQRLGTMSTNATYHPNRRNFSITTNRTPKYVIVESPDFWTDEVPLGVSALRRTNGEFFQYGRDGPEDKFFEERITTTGSRLRARNPDGPPRLR